MLQHLPKLSKMIDIEKTLKSTDINYLIFQLSETKKWKALFDKSVTLYLEKGKKVEANQCADAVIKYEEEEKLINERIDEIKSNFKKRTYSNFPIIDVPANGNANWYEGAYTLCFVYSKHNGNFILRGWRGEVMKYLEKNYTHYFCNISMWYEGRSRNSWKFWKDSVTIFEPKKIFNSWKFKIVKYDGSGMFTKNRKKELTFKRLPNRWIKQFDEL